MNPEEKSEIVARMIFDIFDKDKSGEITLEEFQLATKEIGVKLSRDKAEEKFRKADINGDGRINFEEFRDIAKKLGQIIT